MNAVTERAERTLRTEIWFYDINHKILLILSIIVKIFQNCRNRFHLYIYIISEFVRASVRLTDDATTYVRLVDTNLNAAARPIEELSRSQFLTKDR